MSSIHSESNYFSMALNLLQYPIKVIKGSYQAYQNYTNWNSNPSLSQKVSRSIESASQIDSQPLKVSGFKLEFYGMLPIPTYRDAYIINDFEKIKAILQQHRNADFFEFGLMGLFEQTIGKENMLLSSFPDHRRLRAPLEGFFKMINSEENFVDVAQKVCSSMIQFIQNRESVYSEDRSISRVLPNILRSIFLEVILGIKISDWHRNALYDQIDGNLKSLNPLERESARKKCKEILYAALDTCVEGKVFAILFKQDNLDMSDEEKLSTIITLIEAGKETTEIMSRFLLSSLIKHPSISYDIYKEWKLFSENAEFNSSADFFHALHEFMQESQWVQATYWEILRLCPAFAYIPRVAKEDLQIDDLHIKRGDEIALNIFGYQRSATWGEKPNEFNPQRFIDDPSLSLKLMNFSIGSQHCIGKKFAEMELKLLIGTLCIAFDLANCIHNNDDDEPLGVSSNTPFLHTPWPRSPNNIIVQPEYQSILQKDSTLQSS